MLCKSPLMVSLSIRQQGTLLDYGSHVVAACTSLNASQQNMFVFKKWLMNPAVFLMMKYETPLNY